MRNLKDDRVAVLPGPAIRAVVDESEVAVGILFELIAVPNPRAGRQVELGRRAVFLGEAPRGKVGAVVEKLVAIELQQRLWDRQLARFRHRIRYVVKLRGVVDRTEEAGEIVKERVIPAADKRLNRLAVRCLYLRNLVELDGGREVAAGKSQELQPRLLIRIDGDPHLRRLKLSEVLLLNRIKVPQERL